MRALARRAAPTKARGQPQPPSFGGLRADDHSPAIYHHGVPLELASREAALLRALLVRPGQALAKERLFELVFAGEPDVQPDAIEVVAYRLRKKLSGVPVRVVTLRGLGYLLQHAP